MATSAVNWGCLAEPYGQDIARSLRTIRRIYLSKNLYRPGCYKYSEQLFSLTEELRQDDERPRRADQGTRCGAQTERRVGKGWSRR